MAGWIVFIGYFAIGAIVSGVLGGLADDLFGNPPAAFLLAVFWFPAACLAIAAAVFFLPYVGARLLTETVKKRHTRRRREEAVKRQLAAEELQHGG